MFCWCQESSSGPRTSQAGTRTVALYPQLSTNVYSGEINVIHIFPQYKKITKGEALGNELALFATWT